LAASRARLGEEGIGLRFADFPRLAETNRLRYVAAQQKLIGRLAPKERTLEHPMAIERTFSIIKPDATRRNLTGAINAVIEAAGLRIVAQKRLWMTQGQAEAFYGVHRERPFFKDLVSFMTSGPVVVQVLEAEGAVAKYRDVMGATNPANAAEGTIRKLFAESIEANSVHGSDSIDNAALEIGQFFSGAEIVG
jgi:nucleoside-diphosphate kinase